MDRRWLFAGVSGLLLGGAIGWFAAGSGAPGSAESAGSAGSAGSAKGSGGKREPLYWVAPMDSNYRRDGPGKSPMGMDLVPVYEEQGTDAPGVRVSPTLAHNFGVRLATVQRATLELSIDTLGTVALADPQIEHIHPRIAGWIETLVADAEGDPVRAGQVLLELYSPALVRAQEEFLVALGSGEDGLLDASSARLRALGMVPGQIEALSERGRARDRIALRAGRDGFLLALNVREGMYVEPGTEIMSIAALDPVWVNAELFERDVPGVRPGQAAELTLDYLPGERWRGQVDYIHPRLDPAARTLRVRVAIPNPEGVLRPGMFGRLSLRPAETAPTLQIPAEALIHGVGDGGDRVVVALGDDRYGARAVRVGRRTADRVEILAGLREGERVVASGQFLIDSESDVDAELLRMGAGGAASGSMDHSGMEHPGESAMEHPGQSAMDHSGMEHPGQSAAEMDHSTMEHPGESAMEMDHSTMDHSTMEHAGEPAGRMEMPR